MNKKKSLYLLTVFVLLLMTVCIPVSAASAKSGLASYKQVTERKSQRFGNVTISIKLNGKSLNQSACNLYVKKGNTKQKIATVNGDMAVTNGKYVYYSTGTYQSAGITAYYSNRSVWRYTISSGRKQKMLTNKKTGMAFTPFACDGTYLYIGNQSQYQGEFYGMTVLNLKSGKKKTFSYDVDRVQNANGKLLVSGCGFPHGAELYLINRDGSKAKRISRDRVTKVTVKGKYIYYTETTETFISKKYRCKLDGKNRKVVK